MKQNRKSAQLFFPRSLCFKDSHREKTPSSSGVTGLKSGQGCVFRIFKNIHWCELSKDQYGYYITFLTTVIDLSMKYKRETCVHYEIQSSMVTPSRKIMITESVKTEPSRHLPSQS